MKYRNPIIEIKGVTPQSPQRNNGMFSVRSYLNGYEKDKGVFQRYTAGQEFTRQFALYDGVNSFRLFGKVDLYEDDLFVNTYFEIKCKEDISFANFLG